MNSLNPFANSFYGKTISNLNPRANYFIPKYGAYNVDVNLTIVSDFSFYFRVVMFCNFLCAFLYSSFYRLSSISGDSDGGFRFNLSNMYDNTDFHDVDLDPAKTLRELKISNVNRLIIGQLDINSLRNKFDYLNPICTGGCCCSNPHRIYTSKMPFWWSNCSNSTFLPTPRPFSPPSPGFHLTYRLCCRNASGSL